ncbi:MAG: TonB-dependent receptor plug domain-containing protein [Bacteroidales bacterium]|nr:TonB-dependent receptor plug domain-containing protein [Bacteroidales bacterium]
MKRILLLLSMIAIAMNMHAQRITLSGMVTDSKTGESLLSANVYADRTTNGTVSNDFGFYSLTINPGKQGIVCSFIGYTSQRIELNFYKDTVIHFQLEPTLEIEEVTVVNKGPMHDVKSTQMGAVELPIRKIKTLPVLLGEVDIIKSLQLMPGVSGGVEGSTGIYVRGGGPDQNLILLDGVPVYNANHLFGFFSVFNADAIKSVTLLKGGFPARYGGRLSSVIDIRMKDGNMKQYEGEVSIGLLSSKAVIEGPIWKDRTSFIVTARRTYLDALTYPFQILINMANNGAGYKAYAGAYFYDVNAKINHIINDKNRIFLSGYFGKDEFFMNDEYRYESPAERFYEHYTSEDKLDWGNATTVLRWNHIFSARLFSNMDLTYSNYALNTGSFMKTISSQDTSVSSEMMSYDYFSRIQDMAFKYQFEYRPAMNHEMRFGISNTLHYFSPGVSVQNFESLDLDANLDTTYGESNLPANEFYAYVEDDFSISKRLKANLGFHYSNFYVRDTFYHSYEPRISLRYLLKDNLSIKASYVKMSQYLHLLTNSTIGLPTDLWIPVTDRIVPQKSWQVSLGAVLGIRNNYEFSIEGYYKNMENLTEYREGASFTDINDTWEALIVQGRGWSYGIEFFFQKTLGKTTGWVGYTLAKTERQFEEISFGRVFPFKYDRRHDVSVVLTHKLNERIDFGGTWVYATGHAFTLGDEFFVNNEYYEEQLNPAYEGYDDYYYPDNPEENYDAYFEHRNSYRMPTYHRLDLGVNLHKQKKRVYQTVSFGVYNVYGRQNPLYVRETMSFNEENLRWEPALQQLSILTFIPYFRYSIKF